MIGREVAWYALRPVPGGGWTSYDMEPELRSCYAVIAANEIGYSHYGWWNGHEWESIGLADYSDC